MTDTPTAYPPPQIVITYSGGRYHVDVAGEEGQEIVEPPNLLTVIWMWAERVEAAQ